MDYELQNAFNSVQSQFSLLKMEVSQVGREVEQVSRKFDEIKNNFTRNMYLPLFSFYLVLSSPFELGQRSGLGSKTLSPMNLNTLFQPL